jgi:hypothetical protein
MKKKRFQLQVTVSDGPVYNVDVWAFNEADAERRVEKLGAGLARRTRGLVRSVPVDISNSIGLERYPPPCN